MIYRHGNYMVSIDWLQAYCLGSLIHEGEFKSSFGKVEVTREPVGTANFHRRLIVRHQGREVATILQEPKFGVFDRNLTEVKLHNRVLYTCRPAWFLMELVKVFKLEYRGISRIDLCCDCNSLLGGRSVEDLIASFVHKRVGEIGHVVRRGSARYCLHGNNHRRAAINHESIKFGSVTSSVVPYIYNKSLELIEVKDKPWIREAWKNAGLVHLVDEDGLQKLSAKLLAHRLEDQGISDFVKCGVWRFELSIKCKGKDLLNLADGELFKLSLDSVSTAEKIEELFMVYAVKYFDFRECDRGQFRIRDYKPIQLWKFTKKVDYRPISIPATGSTGRFEHSVSNYLSRAMRQYSDLSSPLLASLQDAKEFISTIAGAKLAKLRAERYHDYLAQLEGHMYFESLLNDVKIEQERSAELEELHREFLAVFNSENSLSTKTPNAKRCNV